MALFFCVRAICKSTEPRTRHRERLYQAAPPIPRCRQGSVIPSRSGHRVPHTRSDTGPSCLAHPRPGITPARYLSLDLRDLCQRAAHLGDLSRARRRLPRLRPSSGAARPAPAVRKRTATSRGSKATAREKWRERASTARRERARALTCPGVL